VQPNAGPLSGEPGGIPLFENGCLVGGIGVDGGSGSFVFDTRVGTCSEVTADEAIALGAVAGFSVPPELRGDRIFIGGIRFLFANAETPPPATLNGVLGDFGVFADPVTAALPTRYPQGDYVDVDASGGWPHSGSDLSASEVDAIIGQAAAQAGRTRAAIRRPIGVPAQVFVSVVDVDGTILGVWRTPDATLFSFDVSVQKARTAVAFSSVANVNPACEDLGKTIRDLLGLPRSRELAMTTRAVGFLAQEYFPPGIDRDTLDRPVTSGPLWEGENFALQQRLNLCPLGNGITIFPGGIPLYRDGQLVGAIGVSGDGVDQDDLIAYAGAGRFLPPSSVRCDQVSYDGVRLPFVKFPRQPETESD
jgi:uncharacterized protein GlcG (DUF336 family)